MFYLKKALLAGTENAPPIVRVVRGNANAQEEGCFSRQTLAYRRQAGKWARGQTGKLGVSYHHASETSISHDVAEVNAIPTPTIPSRLIPNIPCLFGPNPPPLSALACATCEGRCGRQVGWQGNRPGCCWVDRAGGKQV